MTTHKELVATLQLRYGSATFGDRTRILDGLLGGIQVPTTQTIYSCLQLIGLARVKGAIQQIVEQR